MLKRSARSSSPVRSLDRAGLSRVVGGWSFLNPDWVKEPRVGPGPMPIPIPPIPRPDGHDF